MSSFYGGPQGQSFRISRVFNNKKALLKDLDAGWGSPVDVGEYVYISYGSANGLIYNVYPNTNLVTALSSYTDKDIIFSISSLSDDSLEATLRPGDRLSISLSEPKIYKYIGEYNSTYWFQFSENEDDILTTKETDEIDSNFDNFISMFGKSSTTAVTSFIYQNYNRKVDLGTAGIEKTYNGTLWQKINILPSGNANDQIVRDLDSISNVETVFESSPSNGLGYKMICSFSGQTPQININSFSVAPSVTNVIYEVSNSDGLTLKTAFTATGTEGVNISQNNDIIESPVFRITTPSAIQWNDEISITATRPPLENGVGKITPFYISADSTTTSEPIPIVYKFDSDNSQYVILNEDSCDVNISSDETVNFKSYSKYKQNIISVDIPRNRKYIFGVGEIKTYEKNQVIDKAGNTYEDAQDGDYYVDTTSCQLYELASTGNISLGSLQANIDFNQTATSTFGLSGESYTANSITATMNYSNKTKAVMEFIIPNAPAASAVAESVDSLSTASAFVEPIDEDTLQFSFKIPRGRPIELSNYSAKADYTLKEHKAMLADTGDTTNGYLAKMTFYDSKNQVVESSVVSSIVAHTLIPTTVHVSYYYKVESSSYIANGVTYYVKKENTDDEYEEATDDDIKAGTQLYRSGSDDYTYWFYKTDDNIWKYIQVNNDSGTLQLMQAFDDSGGEKVGYTADYINGEISNTITWGSWTESGTLTSGIVGDTNTTEKIISINASAIPDEQINELPL